jgi:EmrB/QacA subfamily drug resistance transporter
VVASYVLSLAVCIPVSGWIADRYGTRLVFTLAIGLFTASSLMCGLSINVPMLVTARIIQGVAAAMMVPVARITLVRAVPKHQLLKVQNFIIVPALIGPLLGPTIGGLIVTWANWRTIFLINIPVGLGALWLARLYMPDFYGETRKPLDRTGLVLFGSGAVLLSWALEVFGEHRHSGAGQAGLGLLVALLLLAAYVWHGRRAAHPLLDVALFKIRTFRVAVAGGFLTRLGTSGLPLLVPLLFQLGLGLPAWQSGMMMMPSVIGAMGMRLMSAAAYRRFGYRAILIFNTVMLGAVIGLFSLVGPSTPLFVLLLLGFAQGFFNSLQFSGVNSLGFADISLSDTSAASTLISTLQTLTRSFALAGGAIITGFFLGGLPQSDHAAVLSALHHSFQTVAAITVLSSVCFWTLRPHDGANLSERKPTAAPAAADD